MINLTGENGYCHHTFTSSVKKTYSARSNIDSTVGPVHTSYDFPNGNGETAVVKKRLEAPSSHRTLRQNALNAVFGIGNA